MALKNGLSTENFEVLKSQLGYRESRDRYDIVGGARDNYLGRYQVGAGVLTTQGYITKDAYNKYGNDAVRYESSWTGKDGVTSQRSFLTNSRVQDQVFYANTVSNYDQLRKNGMLSADASQGDIAGSLAASHLIGPTGFKENGLNGTDKFGTKAGTYYGEAKSAVSNGKFVPTEKGPAAKSSTGTPVSSEAKASTEVYRGGKGVQSSTLNAQKSVEVTTTPTPVDENISLPIINVLEKFSSFNYLFTLSSLTSDQINFPETSYLTGDVGKIIFSSGGRQPMNRVSTAYESAANPSGKFDFYIDDLQITSLIAPKMSTKGTNSVTITFKVTEPYSMGQFLQSCQLAAFSNDHLDYTVAPYLLTIEFMGYDGDGVPTIVDKSTRYIPLNIVQINMTVTQSGCVYDVSGVAWADVALQDSYNILKQDTAITGETVRECLQKGSTSLEYIVNTRLQEIAGEKQNTAKYMPNEIAIIFPKNTVVVGEQADDSAPENDKGATSESAGENAVATKLTLTRSDNILVQDDASVSEIGLAKMGFDLTRGGQFPKPGEGDAHIAGSGGVFQRNLIEPQAGKREFVFKKGTSIINAISEIVLMSDYCTEAIKGGKEKGFYNWFRIETQTFLLTPVTNNQGVNVTPKLLVFRVVPYKIHASKFHAPGTVPLGYDQLRKEAVKEYNYLYTGKNVDVLAFDIKLESAFFTSMYADGGRYNDVASNATRDSQGVNDTAPSVINNPGGKSGDSAEGLATVGTDPKRFKNADGSAADNYKTLVAKAFQHRILNSDVSKVAANMTIMGDPYFIADSGTGNYTNTNSTNKMNLTSTGAMDYQSGEVDIIINFFTPVDINPDTGAMEFAKKELDVPFSGLYQVITVKNNFSRGKFTQELQLTRRPNQDPVEKSVYQYTDSGAATTTSATDDNAKEESNSATDTGNNQSRVVESSTKGDNEEQLNDSGKQDETTYV